MRVALCSCLLLASVSAWCQTGSGSGSEESGILFSVGSLVRLGESDNGDFVKKDFRFSKASNSLRLPVGPTVTRPVHCSSAGRYDFATQCAGLPAFNVMLLPSDRLLSSAGISPEPKRERFQWGPALWQSLEMMMLEHTFRIMTDANARYMLFRRPFWHNYFASASHFIMNRWGDGDDFLVNYIGHPLQGSVTGDIFIQNDPEGRAAKFGKSAAYWRSRLKGMAWAAVYSAYFEIGPVLSEAAIGNEGGYSYYPGCARLPCRIHKPLTNNTGWVDFVVTPTIGLGWILLEDSIERKIVDRLAQGRRTLKYNILRGALAPSRSMSNMLAGKLPWYRYADEPPSSPVLKEWTPLVSTRPAWKDGPRWDLGFHVMNLNLPGNSKGCPGCRAYNPGAGFDLGYRLARLVYASSEFNFFPMTGPSGAKRAAWAGLFGPKIGRSFRSWGVYWQIRPGFIRYEPVPGPGAKEQFDTAVRFVFDLGGVIDYYASRSSAIRFQLGTNLVRYAVGPDRHVLMLDSMISSDYVATQGNFYLGGGYVFRF
jgi:hypothetical protein